MGRGSDRTKRALCYTSVVLNCLTAGSIFTFPLFSVPFSRSLHLTATQTTTIASCIILGEYATAPLFGSLVDRRGPGAVSSCAAVLFAIGWGMLSWRYDVSVDLEKRGHQYRGQWLFLAAYAFLAGAATAASYFSAIIASTKSVSPKRAGLAIGVPCALFGLSPLLLSSLATRFTAPLTASTETELDPGRWLRFLAILLTIVNFMGAVCLKELPPAPSSATSSENEPLLPGNTDLSTAAKSHSFFKLMSLSSFWVLGTILFLTVGPCEMVQSCLGSIVQALMPVRSAVVVGLNRAFEIRKHNVQIISVSNTIARLAVGWISDSVSSSPTTDHQEQSSSTGTRKKKGPAVSRIAFVVTSCAVLVFVFAFTALFMDDTARLWVLSLGVGASYGALFTLCPAIVRAIYPHADFGRNWGLLNWFSALSSVAFTPLYGIFSDRKSVGGICASGKGCFVDTFVVCTVSVALALVLSIETWRRLRHAV